MEKSLKEVLDYVNFNYPDDWYLKNKLKDLKFDIENLKD